MVDIQVMSAIGLKAAGDAVLRKFRDVIFSIPNRIFQAFLGVQMKLLYIAFRILVCVFKVIQNQKIHDRLSPPNVSIEHEPVCQAKVVKGVKKVRKILQISRDELYGADIKADIPLVKEKMKLIMKYTSDGNTDKADEILDELSELNRPFRDGSWREIFISEPEYRYETDEDGTEMEFDPTIPDSTNVPVNLLEQKKPKETSEHKEIQVCLKDSIEEVKSKRSSIRYEKRSVEQDKNLKQENGVLKFRLKATSTKLEQMLKMSSNLVEELARLNDEISKLVCVSEKMAGIQYELGIGRRLLCEVESDRNLMKLKLATLERMIKEEEEYLDYNSGESGYDETETAAFNIGVEH